MSECKDDYWHIHIFTLSIAPGRCCRKKFLRCVRPKYSLTIFAPSRGQMFFVCTSQCFFNTYCFFHSRKSKLYWRASLINSVNFFGGRSPTVVLGCTRMRKRTSFLIMLPTPAKMFWSSNASQTRVFGSAFSFFLAFDGFQFSFITS